MSSADNSSSGNGKSVMAKVLMPLKWCWRLLRRVNLTAWIFISMVVGVLLGWLAPGFSVNLQPISNVFLYMIQCLIVPLIFSTLAVGIAGHGDDVAKIGRLALKSIIYFEILTVFALALGTIMANLLKPGKGVSLAGADASQGEQVATGKSITWESELYSIVPKSFFKAAVDNEVLQIVFCSVMFAIAMIKAPKHVKQPMLVFLTSLSELMFIVTKIVMNFAPLGIGASLAYTIGKSGVGILATLGKLLGYFYLSLIVFVVVILLPNIFLARIPLKGFIQCIGQPTLIGFSTASSEAALPLAMENLQKFGVPQSIVAFVMPVGYSFNLAGTTLYLALASIFAAQAGGINMPLGQQVVMMFTLMLTSKGVAAVPRASLVILLSTLQSFDLPVEAVAVIMGVDALMDMGRTAINIIGNCLATVVLAKWENDFGKQIEEDRVSFEQDLEEGHDHKEYDTKEQVYHH
ncbi:glutamate-aspartate carrier protein [Basidiobolus meristosporus CBS 931.73]|uniref:Amino acid transporter n=1 Tax=Basidiobolus meristosporus CBS 931.73 TaxID=1314790 RepID=A0A1Y1YVK1_9FUNG|nr:glutamate-aspartate carrier protein [Basidiobolus meristosporus CBS 931.73]|eukprot:ORY02021.1 glutamate-aspartate carrier protein [Basidiobolus meristosporus CBS 931.73]